MKLKATSKIEINRNSIQKVTYSSPLFTQVSHAGNTTGKTAGKTGGYHPSTTPSSPQYRNQNLTQQGKRICNHVRKLINNNFNPYHSLFITATFADSNMTDLVECNKEFQKFLAKIKRHYSDFEYVAVASFQKRGVIHYHMVSNLPTDSTKHLRIWWSHGTMHCRRTNGVYGIAHYMVQNLQYNFAHINLPKHYRLHFASKNLNKPIVFREWNGTEIADYYTYIARLVGLNASYTNIIASNHCGRITYQTYSVSSDPLFPYKPIASLSKTVQKKKSKEVEPF